MHFHLPRPLHGWREFAGEVGIIVIGVLVALGAEQFVEAAHWRSEVHNFRSAVDYEIGRNLAIYQLAIKERPCVDRRLADLERLLAASRDGRQLALARRIGKPLRYSPYFSTWDNKGADVTEHLTSDVRTGYGELYDEFRNAELVRNHESEVWSDMAQYDEAEPLSHDDRMRLRQELSRAEALNAIVRPNYIYIANLARPLGIRPIADPQNSSPALEASFCQPLLAGEAPI